MKLAWLTDPHLNFASILKAEQLVSEVQSWSADALLVTGDVGEAPDLEGWLVLMAQRLDVPVYFVLGNHDFYGSSVQEVREDMRLVCESYENLFWLTQMKDVVSLTQHTGLVGHDGWGDARAGTPLKSRVMLNDFFRIQELREQSDKAQLCARLQQFGDEVAEHFRDVLPLALQKHEHVLVLMHVPPFVEAAWHEGNISDEEWAPFFVCQAAGEVLQEIMAQHSSKQMTVLCGHTHSGGESWIAPNLRVRTGGAVYRRPALQDPILIL